VDKFISNIDINRPDGSLRPIEEDPALCALRGEIVTGYEYIVRIPANGELRHRQINSSSIRDPKGNIIGSISVVWDITEIKTVEKALRESEAKYRDLFETMQEVFFINRLIYDEQGNVIDWIFEDLNPAGFKLLGLKDINKTKGKRG
jgi:PAS domain-containing protein